jgi:glycerophosphoryl diester phosphodiesterase
LKNYAHRGFSARYPENTLLAFQKAIEAKCDSIELDIHLTRDGEIVIIHDEEVDRTTDGHGFVKDHSYAELRRLNAGQGERISTLDEYFDLVEEFSIVTNIEMKNSIFRYEGMEEAVIKKICNRGLEKKIIFSSFNHFSMLKCKKLIPEIKCGFLVWSWFIDIGAYTKKHGIDYIHPEYNALTGDAVKEIRNNGIGINAYTVNRREDMERLVEKSIDGIITDEPELLREVLQQKKQ